MSHVKAGGTSKNLHNNAGQRLGVKRFGGTFMSRNFTIHAAIDGKVVFVKTKKNHFSGKSVPRTRVEVHAA